MLGLPLLLSVLASSTGYAASVWKGDFETGSLKQWWVQQVVSSDRIGVVSDPIRQGKFAAKFIVRQGDNPISASGNRNELVADTNEATGSEFYYKWNTLFPSNYPIVNKWQVFVQWHQKTGGGSPPLEFYVLGSQLRLRVGGLNGKVVWTAPIDKGHWHDFVLHVKWSPSASVGFVEMYHNGKLEVPKQYIATQYSNDINYLKMGLYRDATITQEGVVYHDGMVQATSLNDVMAPVIPTATNPTAGTGTTDPSDAAPPLAPDQTDPNGPLDLPVASISPDAEPDASPAGDLTAQDMGISGGGCSSTAHSAAGALPWALGLGALAIGSARRRRQQA